MVRFRVALRVLTGIAVVASGAHAPRVRAAEPAAVIVELFTSEGCSSCPPADALLQWLVDAQPVAGAQIIALGEHVDYWDQQGWRDRFSSAALTNRQRTYARALSADSIYTPQMIVDGAVQLVGSDAAAARRAIARALSTPHGRLAITLEPISGGGRLAVAVTASGLPAAGRGDHHEVVVAVTEDHLTSDVRRGENRGRTLTHAGVVRQLSAIGEATGQPVRVEIAVDPSWRADNVRIVAFVQESRSRRIVAAAAAPLQGAAIVTGISVERLER